MCVPERGQIWVCDLEPTRGGEQRGKRPVLVLTVAAFNRKGLMLACPITQGGSHARDAGFAVPLQGGGTETQGVVLTHQSRTMDWKDRQPRFVEDVPAHIIDDVLARVIALLE